MKRLNNLLPLIADPDNLRLAFWKARKGKNQKKEVQAYRNNLDKNILLLRNSILTANVDVGNYHYFKIFEPKERLICAATFQERVLHHGIMNVCHPVFENYQIFDSYASRKEKGTHAAIARANIFHKKYKWFLKLDVRKFFDSIDHKTLKSLLSKKFKDYKLLAVFSQIIDSYHSQLNKGLPIGNLTSQYFANHYLAISDHYVNEKLKIKGYVRYMDDMVLWANNKTALLEIGNKFQLFIKEVLKLELKPFCLHATHKGLPYLGYILSNKGNRLNKNSKKRFIKKIKYYTKKVKNQEISQETYQNHLLPLLAFTKHADTYNFRVKVLESI
jgi:retron-type reverse transcriptase